MGGSERVQLSGVFNVRKGKLALPVNRWSKRQVTLSGTCLIVSSVKHAHTGKMHILPLIGGKVRCFLLVFKLLSSPLHACSSYGTEEAFSLQDVLSFNAFKDDLGLYTAVWFFDF